MAQLIENYMEDPTFKKIMESGIFEYASRGGLTIGKVHYEGNKNKFDRKAGKIVHFSDEYSVLFVKDGKPVRRDYFTIRLHGEYAGMVSRRA